MGKKALPDGRNCKNVKKSTVKCDESSESILGKHQERQNQARWMDNSGKQKSCETQQPQGTVARDAHNNMTWTRHGMEAREKGQQRSSAQSTVGASGKEWRDRLRFTDAGRLGAAMGALPGPITIQSTVAMQRLMNQRMRRMVTGYEDLQGSQQARERVTAVQTVPKFKAKPESEVRKKYARAACQVKQQVAPEPPDAISVTPGMARIWQELTVQEFDKAVSVKRLRGIDREAWTRDCKRTVNHVKDYTKELTVMEAKILRTDTPFALHLKQLQVELQLPILPSIWKLPFLLSEVCQDEHPMAAQVWINWSRGVEMIPQETDVPATDVANYEPATDLLRSQAPVEVQRHIDEGYAMLWQDIRAQYGIADDKPNNVLPLNIQEKNEEVCRLTLDPANSGDNATPPLNESVPKPPCKLPVFERLVKAVKQGSKLWRGDWKDAFLNQNTRPSSMKYVGFRNYDGKMYALVRMGLGFRHSSATQQRTTTAMLRMHHRRLVARGLTCRSPQPEYDKAPQSEAPGTGHEMTVALGYSDDTGCACTTWLAAWFSFLHWLILNMHAGMELGFKPGKTDPPMEEMIWIGFYISTIAMKWGLPVDWMHKLRVMIAPWADGSKKHMTVRQADQVLGSLQHASRVVKLGRGYFAELQTIKNALGNNRHPAREFRTSLGVRGMMCMWTVLLENMALTSAFIQCARREFPHVGFSDASFDIDAGWCWAIMGVIQYGRWPEEWTNRIGRGSEYEEIWITELEIWACLYMLRAVASRAAHMTLKLKCDNLGVVYILTRLSTRSKRISPVVAEIIWICVAFDIHLEPTHVKSEFNTLCDYGTRQNDKSFSEHVCAFGEIHHGVWFEEQLKLFPSRVARPELLHLIPRAEERQYVSNGVDRQELDKLRANIAAADVERAVALNQVLETASC